MRFSALLIFISGALLTAQTPPPPQPSVTFSVEKGPSLPGAPPDKVIITVGDVKITAAQFNQLIDALPAQFQANARGEGRKQYAENLVRVLALAQEGKRRKIDETPAYKIQTMFQNANPLANRTFEQINQEAAGTDADLHKYYDAHAAEFEQVHGRHILVRMQGSPVAMRPGQKDLTDQEALAKAQDIRKKLVAGEDFATLAMQESDDTGSGARGGDLGTFRRNQMVPAFDEEAFRLKPGELSEPVKTQFGYHLIKIEARLNTTFDEAKGDIERKFKPEAAQKAIQELEKKMNPVLDPEFFNITKQ